MSDTRDVAERYCTYCGERIALNEHALRLGAHLPCIGLHVGLWPKRSRGASPKEPEGDAPDYDRIIAQTSPCPACPNVVRNLKAVAHNLLSAIDGRPHKIAERVASLRQAVAAIQPLMDAHFADEEHSHSQRLADARNNPVEFYFGATPPEDEVEVLDALIALRNDLVEYGFVYVNPLEEKQIDDFLEAQGFSIKKERIDEKRVRYSVIT